MPATSARSSSSYRPSETRWPGRGGLADELVGRGLRVQPHPPHTYTFLAFADGDADAITERVVGFMEQKRLAPCGRWWAAPLRESR